MNNKKEELIETEPVKETKTNKSKIIIIIIGVLCTLLLCAGAFIIGTKYANYEEKTKEKETSKETSKDTDKDTDKIDTEKYKYEAHLYETEDGYICGQYADYCNKKVLSIPAETDSATIEDFVVNDKKEPLYILVSDNTYKIYNVTTKELIETPIEDHANANLHTNRDLTELYGFTYHSDDDNGYYNLSTEKTMYENKYSTMSPILGKYIEGYIFNDEEDYDDDEVVLLNINEEKVELSTVGTCKSYDVYEFKDGNFFVETDGCFGSGNSIIYNDNKKIISGEKEETEWSIDNKGNLYILSNNKIEKYNTNGKLLSTSKTYPNILHLIKEFVLYIENDNIYISDGEDVTKIGKWENTYYYHSMISGYYNEGSLTNENEKAAGIYLIFEYDGSNEGPGVEYYFNPETKEVKKYELEYVGGYAKPVLYLYPEEKTNITVNFEKEDNLTTTYPKFEEEWKVTAYPNGDLYDEDGKYYYGLYWEEDLNHKVDFSTGFYVSKDNAISFLEEKLTIIGLNAKERNEFIMYWLPILEKNEHNLVYFELTEERESFNKLEISPKPDSLLRMAIHVKKVNGPQTIKEQKLTTFERTGFTAVEWGGIVY